MGSFGNFGATQDNNAGNNLDTLFSAPNPDTANADGTIAKLTLNWTPTDSSLYYFTYSEGFRPGLLNRPGGRSNPAGTYTVPFAIDTDDLTNFEVGLKTDLLDNTLRFNASLFFSEIEKLQTGIFFLLLLDSARNFMNLYSKTFYILNVQEFFLYGKI